MAVANNKCLIKKIKSEYSHDDTDDDVNDGNSSTSFSLQECMNEFRARRIRRNSSQHRQEHADYDYQSLKNCDETTELELINQNLCNKEQERKCKPCQNGFCYCFTSDSGDGGAALKNSRQNRRTEYSQVLNMGKRNSKSGRTKENTADRTSQVWLYPDNNTARNYTKSNSTAERRQLTAISSIETSPKDAPLIHIIQELRDNCVISKVKINKYKIQSKPNICSRGKNLFNINHNKTQFTNEMISGKSNKVHTMKMENKPPILENFCGMYSQNDADNLSILPLKTKKCCDRRCNTGGQLLKKRLSTSKLSYKPCNTKYPPSKPPRKSLTNEDKYSGSSILTSQSVREAERAVDHFLQKRTTKADFISKRIKSAEQTKNSKHVESGTTTNKGNVFSTYNSLSDIERLVDSKKSDLCSKNIIPVSENEKKITSIAWSEQAISDMLNYEASTGKKIFHSSTIPAQPQELPSSGVEGNEKLIAWQMPAKTSLDTVDGIVSHNLVSNLEDKSTPVKTKFSPLSKKTKYLKEPQKFHWSEQLRQVSPWFNIRNEGDKNKSNLCLASKAFIKSSKQKILRLVSPKKENMERSGFKIRKTPYRNIAVQTSCDDISRFHEVNVRSIHDHSCTPQSPPGSYHSPIQTPHFQYPSSTQSKNSSANNNEPAMINFDFSRKVNSPKKKATRSSQRKLHFPLTYNHEDVDSFKTFSNASRPQNEKKTYFSFNSELNNDVSLSKISCILSNIRSKLEASDQQTARAFKETENVVDHQSLGYDCPDGHHTKRIEEHVNNHPPKSRQYPLNDPIYSEIEDDTVHISESPNFESHTGIQHFIVADNPKILYAKVNKCNKQLLIGDKFNPRTQPTQIPLAKIMQDSLQNKKSIRSVTLLPPLAEPPQNENVAYTSPSSLKIPAMSHCQSLNNMRVMEENSIHKKQRYLCKSDFSLYRSEIFLENLCRSELIIEGGIDRINREKKNKNIQSHQCLSMTQPSLNDVFSKPFDSDQDYNNSNTVSYELPNDDYNDTYNIDSVESADNCTTAGSNMGLSATIPLTTYKQSTPKKQQSFTTKDKSNMGEFNLDMEPMNLNITSYSSCPNTPLKANSYVLKDNQLQPLHFLGTNEAKKIGKSNITPRQTVVRYRNLKNVLQKSFRKSKTFIIAEGKRLSTSLNFLTSNNAAVNSALAQPHTDVDLNVEALFSLNEYAPVSEQIAKTVRICRKFPDLEVSTEMVEAERLLLFSSLRRDIELHATSTGTTSQTMNQKPETCIFVDDMFLPVLSDVNQDMFFNYYYIITFECGGVIKSTQSAECKGSTAVFRDCGIEFFFSSELKTNMPSESQNAIKCNIFMLRLRKISTVSIEPWKRIEVETLTQSPLTTLTSTSSSSSSLNEVVSRFRLHASFTLNAIDFAPYEYVHQESNKFDRICIRASCYCNILLTHQTKSTKLIGHLRLKGRAEVRFPKQMFGGFLNVENSYSQHNWNRRWCTIDGLFLYVWEDESILNVSPLLSLDLRRQNIKLPLTISPRELCARPRSFCLENKIIEESKNASKGLIFFAAETQENLNEWLKNLNIVLEFIVTWL